MRLICPNCAAQYEIDDALIPDGGRDVQCSNCGHTWFEDRAEALTALAEEADSSEGETLEKRPPRRELDAKTKQILREEAEREAAQRRAAAEVPVEEQTEMGLAPAEASRPKGLQDLPDRFPDGDDKEDDTDSAEQSPLVDEGQPPEPATKDAAEPLSRRDPDAARSAAALAASSRGDLLPDIDQINSTLTATSERQHGADPDDDFGEGRDIQPPSGSGFRLGFSAVLVLTVIAMLVYFLAPQIATAVPTLEPSLAAYVEAVNGFRATLDGWLISASEAIIGAADN